MVTSNITIFIAQRHAIVAVVKANKAPPPPPIKNDLFLVIFMSATAQEDLASPRIDRGIFQALLFFQPMQQFYQGKPSHQPPSQSMMLGHEMLPNIQRLQAKLGMHGANNLLNNAYNLV